MLRIFEGGLWDYAKLVKEFSRKIKVGKSKDEEEKRGGE